MRWLYRLATPRPAPPVNAIWNEIEAREIGFSGYSYLGEGGVVYVVTLRFERESVDCRVEGRGRTFDEALASAWERWPKA